MLRMAALAQTGLFDEQFYMYLEDADLGWKLRQCGWEVCAVPASVVRHKYEPNAPTKYYRHLERNRWLLLLTYYKWRTLLLLSPALVAMEMGQVLYAMMQRSLMQKLASWSDLLQPSRWKLLQERRRARDSDGLYRIDNSLSITPAACICRRAIRGCCDVSRIHSLPRTGGWRGS